MADFEFREIISQDREALAVFFSDNNVPSVVNDFTAFPLTTASANFITDRTHEDKYYLCLENGRIVGFSMLRGWEEGYTVPSFGIFVDHRAHGKGLGKQILRLTLDEAQKLGCKQVRLTVFGSNPAAVHIYASAGFVETERKTVGVDGVLKDKIVMIKDMP